MKLKLIDNAELKYVAMELELNSEIKDELHSSAHIAAIPLLCAGGKVLVACEESQEVTIAFRNKGIEAFSCDLQECSGGHPEWHLQMNIFEAIKLKKWSWIISFQPCTDLAVSGCRWFDKKRESGNQEKSIRFFFEVWKISNCSENPIGILNGGNYIRKYFPLLYKEMVDYGFPFKPSQIIHPYMFGDGERKSTCLWLKGLPLLQHNSKPNLFNDQVTHVDIDWIIGKNGKRYTKTHYGSCFKTNKNEQGKLRSKTYPGIAKAMAEQWSAVVACT